MSRNPRVFGVVEQQTYRQNEDRIRMLNAALNGLSHLMNDRLLTYDLSQAEYAIVREELIRSVVKNSLDNLTDEQIIGHLDEIEVELEAANE